MRIARSDIEGLIAWMKRPRLMCICWNIRLTGKEEMDWHKCACGGWVSAAQLMESRHDDIGEPL